MSRVLPSRPNLDHLKKQAKDLLPELQARSAGARLADAQHAVARDYGFASWPKLKAHILSITGGAFAGRWIADVARSQRHPANQFRSAQLEITTHGPVMTIVDSFVFESGDRHRGENVLHLDGTEHATARDGYRMTCAHPAPHIVEAVVTNAGREEGRVRYELSEAGRTLTLTDGRGLMRVVFERVAT